MYELTSSRRSGDKNEISKDGKRGNDLMVLSFQSIVAATDNFSADHKLGQGGFGTVYKVNLLVYLTCHVKSHRFRFIFIEFDYNFSFFNFPIIN